MEPRATAGIASVRGVASTEGRARHTDGSTTVTHSLPGLSPNRCSAPHRAEPPHRHGAECTHRCLHLHSAARTSQVFMSPERQQGVGCAGGFAVVSPVPVSVSSATPSPAPFVPRHGDGHPALGLCLPWSVKSPFGPKIMFLSPRKREISHLGGRGARMMGSHPRHPSPASGTWTTRDTQNRVQDCSLEQRACIPTQQPAPQSHGSIFQHSHPQRSDGGAGSPQAPRPRRDTHDLAFARQPASPIVPAHPAAQGKDVPKLV